MRKHTAAANLNNLYPTMGDINVGIVYTDTDGSYYDSGNIVYSGNYQGTKGGSSGSMVINENYEAVAINFAALTEPYGQTVGFSLYTSLYLEGNQQTGTGYNLINGYGGFYP
jgi:hypothetical protein